MTEKNVLIITYYWPPSGGSGVQRWLKFVKYLPAYGYTPYVFTPENPAFDLKDESLLNDVPPEAEIIHFPIWEPYKLFSKASQIVGFEKSNGSPIVSEKKSWFQKASTWVRGNLIIPDPRVFWVRPSVKFLSDFVREKDIRMIITTGPPHSVHLIGLGLKNRNPSLKWIADFRDPWSTWGFLDSLGAGTVARRLHRFLENKVFRRADLVVTITPFYVRQFKALSNRNVELLMNGFDEEDFLGFTIRRTEKFTIRHVGIVNERCNPRPLMLAIKALIQEDEEFASSVCVDFIGDVHPDFKRFVTDDHGLSSVTTFTPPIQHKALIGYYEKSSLLLLILTGYRDAEGYLPGKLFEYLATGLPVLGVGPINGDAGKVISETQSGHMVDSENGPGMKQVLLKEFADWKSNKSLRDTRAAQPFSRRGNTARLADLLEELRRGINQRIK